MHGRWRLTIAALLVLIAGEGRTVGGHLVEHGFQALDGFQAQDVHINGQAADRVKEQGKGGAALENKIQSFTLEAADQLQGEDVFLQSSQVAGS